MVRLLLFFAALALAAYGLTWLAENPGEVTLTWRGVEVNVSLMLALGIVLALAIALGILWTLIRFVFRAPSLISLATNARRREKGYLALSRGMIAVGSGDAQAAHRHAADSRKFIADEPLTLLLRAQSAQLAGDRPSAVAAFNEMLEHPQTHTLGLRGLHVEARRSGDHQAALDYAARAHKYAALPWAAQAVLDDRAAHGDWAGALATVEFERVGQAAGQADRQPLARGAEDRHRAGSGRPRPQGRAGAGPGGLRAGARPDPRRGAQRPADGGRGRLSPGLENPGGGVSANAASGIGRHLSAPAARRFRVGSSGPRAGFGPGRAVRRREPIDGRPRRARRARSRGGADGVGAAAARRYGRVAADGPRVPVDGGNRGGRRRRRRGARMAEPRRPRPARSRLGRRRGDHRSLVARIALGRAGRFRLAYARRAAELARARPAAARPAANRARAADRGADRRDRGAPEPVKAIESPPPASALPPAPSPETPRTPRANGNIVLLPSNAPDDPGPHGTPDRKPGYRLFANE